MIPRKIKIIIFNILRSTTPSLFNFAIAVLGVQYCGAANWGELVSIMIVLFIFSFVANWGNQEYLIRAYSRNPANILTFFYSSLLSRSVFLLISLVLIFFYPINVALLAMAMIAVQFVYKSFNSLIVYHQKFKQQLIAELLGFVIILFAVLFVDSFSVTFFLGVYLLSITAKSVLMISVLKPYPKKGMLRFDKTNIFAAIPFFMIGLSGWMNSKVDLYLVDYFLTPADLSQYQILATAYIMLQGVASFIIYPFSKHIYRLKHISLIRIRKLVGLAGIPIVGIGSWLIWFFLSNYTSVSFSTSIYLIMTIASLPFFLFTVDIYLCYKHQKEKTIMWITFIGAFTILIFVSILTPIYGIFGAVIGICISKWLLLLLYKLKRIK